MTEIRCAQLGLRCEHVARGGTVLEAESRFWLHARSRHAGDLHLMTAKMRGQLEDRVEHLAAGPAVTFESEAL